MKPHTQGGWLRHNSENALGGRPGMTGEWQAFGPSIVESGGERERRAGLKPGLYRFARKASRRPSQSFSTNFRLCQGAGGEIREVLRCAQNDRRGAGGVGQKQIPRYARDDTRQEKQKYDGRGL